MGVKFNISGSWSKTQAYLSIQAKKALFDFKNIASKFGRLPPDVMCRIFDFKIAPTCSTVEKLGNQWVYVNWKDSCTFCRYLLSVPKTTLNDGVRGELGRYPLFIQTVLREVKYWFHILDQNPNWLLFKCINFSTTKQNVDRNGGHCLLNIFCFLWVLDIYGSHKVLPIKRHSFHYSKSAAQMSNYNVSPNVSVLMLS